jgi:hypothetical protein
MGHLMILVAMGLLFFGNADVWGEDWKPLRPNKVGDSNYYDADSITRPSQNIVKGSVKTVYSPKSVNREVEKLGPTYKNLSYRIVLWEMNCSEKKVAFLQRTDYTKNGTIIKTIKPDTITWMSIVPDTMGEELHKLLCK